MLLSNLFSNRLDDHVDSSVKEGIISYYPSRNAISLSLPATWENRIVGNFKLDKRILDEKIEN